MDLQKLTSAVCEIATEGGRFLEEQRKSFDKNRIEQKNSHDYVSYVDKETEKLLVEKLKTLIPDSGFITEEETVKFEEQDYCWIIDPLDGTTNFIYDNPPFCVCIALRYKNEVILGVVYEVTRHECFYAWKGGGSYLNDRKITVSDVTTLENASVGLDLPYDYQNYKPVLNSLIDKLYGTASSVRLYGSAAIGLCYVAAGRFDAWLEAYIKLWDFAAGAIIVQEAGGVVTDFRGSSDFWGSHHVIVSSGASLHTQMEGLVSAFADDIVD